MPRLLPHVTRSQLAIALVGVALGAGHPRLAAAQASGSEPARAGPLDNGKMWVFEYAPSEYFSTTYGFTADSQWFARARLSALRIPGCSAAFVSPNGLVVTNHHCARGAVSQVSRPGETLLDSGFYATSVDAERRIEGYWADQLVATEDGSAEVFAAVDRATTDAERDRARREAVAALEARLRARHAPTAGGDSIHVQIVPLYHGGRYSAYVFRRFTDVRLVAAAELQMGFFGGDADNFTYPRYALDFAFLRVYGRDGRPYQTAHHFTWSKEGVREGDPVFVIGNPGPTNRLNTMAQLEFQRDVQVPAGVAFLGSRLAVLGTFQRARPADAESLGIRNAMFGLSNSLKASAGRLAALRDPVIMARRRDAERQLREAIAARPELQARFGDALDRMAELQGRKTALGGAFTAFFQLENATTAPAVLRRALGALALQDARAQGAPADTVAALRARLLLIGDRPRQLEHGLLAARFADFQRALGGDHPVTRAALGGKAPDSAAAALLATSVLADSTRAALAVAGDSLPAGDPALALGAALRPAYQQLQRELSPIAAAERELASRLGRARFEVYGRTVPPDATGSPRITDGVVQGYDYNGTQAPALTTFYGLYDRFRAFGPGTEWDLPGRWRRPPPTLDLGTPLNFVSTADTYGGNSGSPAVTPGLALVGLNFDRNVEGLSRDFIYLPERGRNIMVDVRAIRAALDHVYDADRIVREIETGRLYRTEREADAARN
ncbi:MAG: S46 family peptidase [Gemmatimonadales bacterium]